MKLLNLDKFISEDRFFRVKGVTFRIPGLIPVENVLRISKLAQDCGSGSAQAEDEVLSELWRTISDANKDKTEQDFRSCISTAMLRELIPYIFNEQGGEEVEEDVVDLSKNGSGGVAKKRKPTLQ